MRSRIDRPQAIANHLEVVPAQHYDRKFHRSFLAG
jgi:hypothetical protein